MLLGIPSARCRLHRVSFFCRRYENDRNIVLVVATHILFSPARFFFCHSDPALLVADANPYHWPKSPRTGYDHKKAIRPACHLATFNTVPRCMQIIGKKIKLCTNPVCRHVARSCSVCHRNEGGNLFCAREGNFNSFQSPTLNLDTSSNGAGGNLTP